MKLEISQLTIATKTGLSMETLLSIISGLNKRYKDNIIEAHIKNEHEHHQFEKIIDKTKYKHSIKLEDDSSVIRLIGHLGRLKVKYVKDQDYDTAKDFREVERMLTECLTFEEE